MDENKNNEDAIVETQVEPTVVFPEDGEIVVDVAGAKTGERVVLEKNEQGEVSGWHKESN